MKRTLILLTICMLLPLCAGAEATLTERIEGNVQWLEIAGLSDELNEKVNLLLFEPIVKHLNTQKAGGNVSVASEWEMLGGRYLSVRVSAVGRMPQSRYGDEETGLLIDLETGEKLKSGDLFTDGAQEYLNAYAEENVLPTLSDYLSNAEISPVDIENYVINTNGITFLYDYAHLSTLSERAGEIQLCYYEMRDILNQGGALKEIIASDSAEALKEIIAGGRLPGCDLQIGCEVSKLRAVSEGDFSDSGLVIETEDGFMRGGAALSRDGESVSGLRTERLNACGLIPGETTRGQWRETLGAPERTQAFDESAAEGDRLPCAGESDYYTVGEYIFRLHADADGVLRMIQTEAK